MRFHRHMACGSRRTGLSPTWSGPEGSSHNDFVPGRRLPPAFAGATAGRPHKSLSKAARRSFGAGGLLVALRKRKADAFVHGIFTALGAALRAGGLPGFELRQAEPARLSSIEQPESM